MLLTTSNKTVSRYKNSKEKYIYFTIDIFSNYKGEKEIYELEEIIDKKASELMDLPNVISVNQDAFSIVNGEDPAIKHGILIYKIQTMEVQL